MFVYTYICSLKTVQKFSNLVENYLSVPAAGVREVPVFTTCLHIFEN